MGRIRIGTSGWSYDDWVGPFYPPGTGPRDFLAAYARHFDIVEVDSTYYRIPSADMVRGWAERTPDGFRFAVKMVNTVTHEKVLVDCAAEVDRYFAALEPLGPKLHSILLQFGYFNKRAFAGPQAFYDRLEAFLEQMPSAVPVAVEIRNKWWLKPPFFAVLARHNAAYVLADQAWMPPLQDVLASHDVMTGPFLYVRLLGDRKGIEEITTTWDKIVVDRTERLRALVEALRKLPRKSELIFFINNHFAGHAPATCRELIELVKDL